MAGLGAFLGGVAEPCRRVVSWRGHEAAPPPQRRRGDARGRDLRRGDRRRARPGRAHGAGAARRDAAGGALGRRAGPGHRHHARCAGGRGRAVAGAARAGMVAVSLGIALIWGGFALRWWAVLELGRFFQMTVVVQENHRVIETGPYRVVRHPSYSGLLLIFVGVGFTLGNWLSVTACVVLPFLGLLVRIRAEEAVLNRRLGEPYRSYSARPP